MTTLTQQDDLENMTPEMADKALDQLLQSAEKLSVELDTLNKDITKLEIEVATAINSATFALSSAQAALKQTDLDADAELNKLIISRSQEIADEETETEKFV